MIARSVLWQVCVCVCAFSVNMPDLIHIWSGSAQKCWPVAGQLASGPDPFGQNLTKNRIQPGFAHLDPGHLWKNTTESESGKLVVGWLCFATTGPDDYFHTSLLPDQIHHAKIWPSHADWIWACFEWYDLGRLWKNGTKLDTGSQIWPDSGCTLAVMIITDHYQNASDLDLVCLLGWCSLVPDLI